MKRTDRPSGSRDLSHVCVVSETYAPETNGVATTLRHLVHGLRRDGVSVDLVLPRHPVRPYGYEAQIHSVPGIGVPGYPGVRCGIVQPATLTELWSRRPPEAVYIATEGPLGLAALHAARTMEIPVVSGYHTRFDLYSHHYTLRALGGAVTGYLRWFHNRTASTLVPDASLARDLRSNGYERVDVLGRGVDTELYSPRRRDPGLRSCWGVDESAPALLYVGRIAAEKNLELAIEAYRKVRAIRPGTRLILVGEGPQRPALQRQHPDVTFAGIRRGEELARFYASADWFLFPSLSETFGNVTLEALASGLPVIAFDYAAAGSVMRDRVHGRLADTADTTAWISAAVGAALLPSDAHEAMRERAASAVAGLAWQDRARELGRILASAADQPSAALSGGTPLCSKH